MKIQKITLFGMGMSSNCYILHKDNKAIVIDPGFEHTNLYSFLENNNLDVEKIILTHGHFDHWGGLKKLREIYPNAKLYASSLDNIWYEVGELNYHGYTPKIDIDLDKTSKIDLFDIKANIYKAPGHSQGSIAIHFDDILISGDVIFYQSIGRTDLEGGNFNQLMHSISYLFTKLNDDTTIYSGHGRPTTIKHEKQFNPFLK